ncbi:hypothetical protein TSAR_014169 [Trichomalopsis sarcophagae]|uniref:Uncharacterized protein n=1 Tax=Trichomalopsis sarcophagae TaxID=543379 RepID=A0A232FKS8_9HYME|nr:hypothetical protein TSAR_014169 [Trichomalopsis sarcophagae]
MHDETAIRRSLIVANVNNATKDTLRKTATDEFLFGSKLSENLKAAKLIEQSAGELKVPKSSSTKSTKNFKPPLSTHNKQGQTGGVERGEIFNNSTCKPQTGITEVRSPEIAQQWLQVFLQEELLPEETLSLSAD